MGCSHHKRYFLNVNDTNGTNVFTIGSVHNRSYSHLQGVHNERFLGQSYLYGSLKVIWCSVDNQKADPQSNECIMYYSQQVICLTKQLA